MTKSVSYTNRKGKTYFLHAAKTRKGVVRHVMKTAAAGALAALPDGHEIVEGVNGEVSVRLKRPQLISPREVQLVESALAELGLKGYRVEAKGKYLTVYEPLKKEEDYKEFFDIQARCSRQFVEQIVSSLPEGSPDVTRVRGLLDEVDDASNEAAIQSVLEGSRVYPVMRFRLADKKERLFYMERMTYRGEGGWRSFYDALSLRDAVEKYLPHLGKESFFELI